MELCILHLSFTCPTRQCVTLQVSSVELERVVIASVPFILEAAAVGMTPPGGGPEQLVMFLVLDKNAQPAGSAQASHADTADKTSQPAAPSVNHQSATEQQVSSTDNQSHSQARNRQSCSEASPSGQHASAADHSASLPSSGHKEQSSAYHSDTRQAEACSDHNARSQSPENSSDRVQHKEAEEQEEHTGGAKATLTDAVAKPTSVAAVAVERVRSAVSPLLTQVQHAAAPLAQQVQAVAAPMLAQVGDFCLA